MKILKSMVLACVLSASCGGVWAMDTKETVNKAQQHVITFMNAMSLLVMETTPFGDFTDTSSQSFDMKKYESVFSKSINDNDDDSLAKLFRDTLHTINQDQELYQDDTSQFQGLVVQLLEKVRNQLMVWAAMLHKLGISWTDIEVIFQGCFETLKQESVTFLAGKSLNNHMESVEKMIEEILSKTKNLVINGVQVKVEMPQDAEDFDDGDVKSASSTNFTQRLPGKRFGRKGVIFMYGSLLLIWQALARINNAEPVALTNVPLHAASLGTSGFLAWTWNEIVDQYYKKR